MLGWGNIEYLLELHEKEMNKTGWISNFYKNEEIRNVEYAKVKEKLKYLVENDCSKEEFLSKYTFNQMKSIFKKHTVTNSDPHPS